MSEGQYEAMLVTCIDPCVVEHSHRYMLSRGPAGGYSHLAIAGAGIAAVAPAFEAWRPAFWDNVATSLGMHRIKRLIVLDHRDCGAAKIAYGEPLIDGPLIETELHRRVLAELVHQASWRLPTLEVECGLIDLEGAVLKLDQPRRLF
jgi:carbonic anhydrase